MPTAQELLDIEKADAMKRASDGLSGIGYESNFIAPMYEKFKNSIVNQGRFDDLFSELQQYVLGDEKTKGQLERYVKQINSDVLTQFTANYTKILTEDIGMEFYVYTGNLQGDSRCFCEQRANKYFHRMEIEAWGNGDVGEAVDENCGYPWQGMIKGTNGSNIFTYRGGWNCEHTFVPVLTLRTPREVVIRAIDKGYYIPSEIVKEKLGIE